MKALFLYDKLDLSSEIDGGVQLCTKEFLEIIKETATEVFPFEVKPSISITFRVLLKLNLAIYLVYKPKLYKEQLKKAIIQHNITHVFINKAELIRFSKIIKELNDITLPKVIIMSHGNESGDLLSDIASERPRYSGLAKVLSILRLGLNLYTESWYRIRFVDLVCTMSEEEVAIEKWLGINEPFLIPRLVKKDISIIRKPILNRFGYVGTLNHSPNINAIYQICEILSLEKTKLELRIVGSPLHIGHELEKKYPFVKYMGAMPDGELLKEIESWAFFINPIFNYSRGSSMKLSKAIEWEIPIITTKAGKRGYSWKEGALIETKDSPAAFVTAMKQCIDDAFDYQNSVNDTILVKKSSISQNEISTELNKTLVNLN